MRAVPGTDVARRPVLDGQLTSSAHGQEFGRRRAWIALALDALALGSAVAGVAVAPFFILAPLVAVGGVAFAVKALRTSRDTTTKVCGVSAIVIGLLVVAAVVWFVVSVAIDPPE